MGVVCECIQFDSVIATKQKEKKYFPYKLLTATVTFAQLLKFSSFDASAQIETFINILHISYYYE